MYTYIYIHLATPQNPALNSEEKLRRSRQIVRESDCSAPSTSCCRRLYLSSRGGPGHLPKPRAWADPKSTVDPPRALYILDHGSAGVQNWGIYFLDPLGGLGRGPVVVWYTYVGLKRGSCSLPLRSMYVPCEYLDSSFGTPHSKWCGYVPLLRSFGIGLILRVRHLYLYLEALYVAQTGSQPNIRFLRGLS